MFTALFCSGLAVGLVRYALKYKGCCAHDREAHEHYRDGTDCGLCACQAYKR